MADANTAAEKVANAVEPIAVSDSAQADGRPANLDISSSANVQFPNPNSNPNPSGLSTVLTPLSIPQASVRPAATPFSLQHLVPPGSGSHFLPGPAYHTPGVGAISPSMMNSNSHLGSGALPQAPVSSVQNIIAQSYGPPGQPLRFVSQIPNGYPGLPPGAMPPPGIPRYPAQYGASLVRPVFPPHPVVGVMPPLARPPLGGLRGPVMPLIVRPPVPSNAMSSEKPQTTVYLGKISSTVENDFMMSLLQLCGPVKSWKRPQDPSGTLKGFGFCEFESAEGVLRALRLLNKLNIDGQELMLNVNQQTRVYLNLYVEKKAQSSKNIQESNAECSDKDGVTVSADTNGIRKSSEEPKKQLPGEEIKKDSETSTKENSADLGLVTEEDREADRIALQKLKGLIEERLKNRQLPPPPPPRTAVDGLSEASESQAALRDREMDGALEVKDSEAKVVDDKASESKLLDEIDRNKSLSPDRIRHRGKDRDRDSKRDKEKEIDRYEREREQERAKREKDKEYRSRDVDRRYKMREKEWEAREREKEHWRKREREREREKAQERKWEILDQERDGDDAFGKKKRYRISDDERRRRQREKEEDMADRLLEEEEIAEAKIREELKKEQSDAMEILSDQSTDALPGKPGFTDQDFTNGEIKGAGTLINGVDNDSIRPSSQNSNMPARKLGFGISASGKRTAVPSVFYEDEDEDAHKEKKMKPLVPIDYSTEEQQAVHSSVSEGSDHHMFAAAEIAKRSSTANPKEEKRERRSRERSSQRDRDRDIDRHEETSHRRDSKAKSAENQKLFDAKQLIDTIPKTKDELFSYKINWTVYDQNTLHERLKPWIAKKITDFLGEEEDTLVEYIVSSTQEHVSAGEMLERLQPILDDEAEMFVLKMWRMLIFEVKRVETGIAVKSRS